MENIVAALGLTSRSVATVELDGRPARRAVLARTFPTDVDDLWDAVTNPERIPRWFMPVSGDLVLGGTYQLEGNAGGTVQECEPPRRFRISWIFGDGPATWVTVTLEPQGAATRFVLEHVGEVPEELWAQFGPSATGMGWDLGLLGLAVHVREVVGPTPEEAPAWMASPEGLACMQASASAWQEADVADGASAEDAAARAARTLAAYTGQPDPTRQ